MDTTRLIELPGASDRILDLLHERLRDVADEFDRQLASDLTAVNELCMHIEHYRGKMLRPALVLLSGMAVQRDPGTIDLQRHVIVAAVVEMIHMATLVHDDVLDDARVRRRGRTLNHLYGNEAAVMLGDYLISNAFHLCSKIGDPAINLALGAVTNTLCAGELVQLHHRDHLGLDEATYFSIIERKTGSLIAECCRLGVALADADQDMIDSMHRVGMDLGIAFQIQDDLLDITGDPDVVGKQMGKDLEKGKLTLPLIILLREAEPRRRGRILHLIEQRDLEPLREELRASGAMEETSRTARTYVDRAREQLDVLPGGPARDVLKTMADHVLNRRY